MSATVRAGPASFDEEEAIWSPQSAHARAKAGEPLTEADKAYFWWGELADRFAFRAARAFERLKNKREFPKKWTWLKSEDRSGLITYPPIDGYRELGEHFNSRFLTESSKKSAKADRDAARYLIHYAELVGLTDGFAGCWREDPNPLREVDAPQCMWLCERLCSLAEAFCHDRQTGGAAMASKADEWRKPVLEIAKEIRSKHPNFGNETIAERVFERLCPEVRERLNNRDHRAIEQIAGCIARYVQTGELARSTVHPQSFITFNAASGAIERLASGDEASPRGI